MWIKISGKKMLFSSVRLIFICTLKTHTHIDKARDNFGNHGEIPKHALKCPFK